MASGRAAAHPDTALLLPVTSVGILATVLAHGLSVGPLARGLKLAADAANGLLIGGASPWSCALAAAWRRLGLEVLVVDGACAHLKRARMDGTPAHDGESLSEHAEHMMETQHLSHLLCATENDFYNTLVCRAQGAKFGHHCTFRLATDPDSGREFKRLTIQQRGHFAFDPAATWAVLGDRLSQGWEVRATRLSKVRGWPEFAARMGEQGQARFLPGGVSSGGAFRLDSKEQHFRLEAGWTALYFAPVPAKAEMSGPPTAGSGPAAGRRAAGGAHPATAGAGRSADAG